MTTVAVDTGLEHDARAEIADGLSHLLADTYTLYLRTHNYHWNVVGPMFQTLHELFERQYLELAGAVDVIAERIRALGHLSPGSYHEFLVLTAIREDRDHPEALEMLRRLLRGHETVVKTARRLFPIAEKAGDQPTMDLLARRMQLHEKTAWALRSLLA